MLARSGNGPIIFTVGGGVGKKTIEIGLLFNVQNICMVMHLCFRVFKQKTCRKTRRYKSCDHANKCKWSAYINGHFLLVFLLGAHFLIGTFSTPDWANSHFFMLLVALLYSLVIFFSLSTFLQSIPVDSQSGQLLVVL